MVVKTKAQKMREYKAQLAKTKAAVQKVKDTKYKAQLEKTAKAVQKVKDTNTPPKPVALPKPKPKAKKLKITSKPKKSKAEPYGITTFVKGKPFLRDDHGKLHKHPHPEEFMPHIVMKKTFQDYYSGKDSLNTYLNDVMDMVKASTNRTIGYKRVEGKFKKLLKKNPNPTNDEVVKFYNAEFPDGEYMDKN